MASVPKRSRNEGNTVVDIDIDYHDRSQSPPKKRRLSGDDTTSGTLDRSSTTGQGGRNAKPHTQSGDWQIVESKSSKKKSKQGHVNDNGSEKPVLRFQTKRQSYFYIKELQELVLYVLADGVAPTWLAVQNAKKIQQALVLMVPGLDEDMLNEFVTSAPAYLDGKEDPINSGLPVANAADSVGSADIGGSSRLQNRPTVDAIISVKAPGDSRYSKVHSPLQAMLIAPSPDTKTNKSAHHNGSSRPSQSTRTQITAFIHSPDELREAEFPIHPAAFTNELDRDLERQRREATGQSESAGWVDMDVVESMPAVPHGRDRRSDFTTQDLDVYALDCEMVLTSDEASSLARVSVLNWHGKVILDKYVKPSLPIKNYFTQYSGITPAKLENVTTTLSDVQQELKKLLTPSSILLGHSLDSDLNALKMTHPFIIDTSMIYPHPRGLPLRSSLKYLANRYLKREIQLGGANGHDSVEDARAVLDLVRQKCEKGAKWGTPEANGESLFRRLTKAGQKSAIVEYGTPERGLGREATLQVGCQNDEEIVQGLIRMLGTENEAAENVTGANFVWGRLRDIETALGWNSNFAQNGIGGGAVKPADGADEKEEERPESLTGMAIPVDGPSASGTNNTTTQEDAGSLKKIDIQTARASTVNHLSQIYEALQPGTLFILYSGTGDMRPVLKLQQMQTQYRKEFKVKKWDELSVKWTDNEEQALRKAAEEARKGCGLLCIKE